MGHFSSVQECNKNVLETGFYFKDQQLFKQYINLAVDVVNGVMTDCAQRGQLTNTSDTTIILKRVQAFATRNKSNEELVTRLLRMVKDGMKMNISDQVAADTTLSLLGNLYYIAMNK